MKRILGIDYGDVRVGLAISDSLRITAQGLDTLVINGSDKKFINGIKELQRKYEFEEVVIGYHKNMNGTIGPRALVTLEFKKKLEETFKIPVEMQDERLSTKEASGYMIKADMSRKKRKKKIDSLAANIILQTYLDKRKE